MLCVRILDGCQESEIPEGLRISTSVKKGSGKRQQEISLSSQFLSELNVESATS